MASLGLSVARIIMTALTSAPQKKPDQADLDTVLPSVSIQGVIYLVAGDARSMNEEYNMAVVHLTNRA